MYRSAWADRLVTAGPEREIRLLLRGASRNLQRLIGNSANEELFFVLVESNGLVVHSSDLFFAHSYSQGQAFRRVLRFASAICKLPFGLRPCRTASDNRLGLSTHSSCGGCGATQRGAPVKQPG